jgi:hypothetical protein
MRRKPDDEIRLIHVDENAVPTDEVQSFRFAPTSDVPYPVRLAQFTPSEWRRIESGALPLPLGWMLEGKREYRRPGKK